MPSNHDNSFFTRLISPMLDQLRRLAHGTRGEHSVDDLKNEAWLAAQDIHDETGVDLAPEDESLQQAILTKLRKAFGRFANRKMRYAVQLDHEQAGDDGEFLPNSLASSLAAPDAYEPEIAIERAEESAASEDRLAGRFTEAVAYLRTLDHFDNDSGRVAVHLAITMGVFKSRLASAATMAELQRSLFDGIETIPRDFVPLRGRAARLMARASIEWERICVLVKPRQQRLFSSLPMLFRRP
ncbi:hypothetical protein [Paraburkholderia sediminicola]|uniref:hypothetical protein n=1 Tax=Paraburkholderia sediminicola TaxID=458836 RepID=UPI0038BB6662